MSFTHKDNRDSRGNSPRVASTASLSSLSMSAVTPGGDEEAPFIVHLSIAGSDERGSQFNFEEPLTTARGTFSPALHGAHSDASAIDSTHRNGRGGCHELIVPLRDLYVQS